MGGLVADGTRVLRLELGHGGPGSIALDLASLGGRRRRSAPAHAPRGPRQSRAAGLRAHRAPLALRHQTETRRAPLYESALGTANEHTRPTTRHAHRTLKTFQSLRLRVGYIVHHHTIDHSITSSNRTISEHDSAAELEPRHSISSTRTSCTQECRRAPSWAPGRPHAGVPLDAVVGALTPRPSRPRAPSRARGSAPCDWAPSRAGGRAGGGSSPVVGHRLPEGTSALSWW